MKLSHPAKMAVCRVQPARAALLGSSYEEDILEALEREFQQPLIQSGLTKKQFLEVIWKAARYYQKGYSRSSEKSKIIPLRDQIAKEMKLSSTAQKSGVLRALLFLDAIKAEKYPVLFAYLTKGTVTIQDRTAAVKTAAKDTASAAADHLKQVAKETVHDAAGLVTSAVNVANTALPWYLRPKVILPVGLVAAALFYGAPLLRMLPKPARQYKQNPVSKTTARAGKRAQAKKKFSEFHDRDADKDYTIPAIDTSELVLLGGALCVGYESDKWSGRAQDYLHDFESDDVKLYSTADGKALVIAGGDLLVKSQGITG